MCTPTITGAHQPLRVTLGTTNTTLKGGPATPDAFVVNLHNPCALALLRVVKSKDEKSGRLSESPQIFPVHLSCLC